MALAVLLMLVLTPVISHAADVEMGGYAKALTSRDLRDDHPLEDISQSATKLFLRARARTSEAVGIEFSAKARYDVFVAQTIEPLVEGHAEADLHELYADTSWGKLDARLGFQIASWGENLFLSPLDAINPPDLRYMLDPDADDARLPVAAARLTYYPADSLTLEAIWIPFFREAGFQLFARDTALLKHESIRVHINPSAQTDPSKALILGDDPADPLHDPELEDRANRLFKATDFPDEDLGDSDGGGRLVYARDPFTLGLSYLYAHDHFPALRASPEIVRAVKDGVITLDELFKLQQVGAELDITYARRHQPGLSLNATVLDTNFGLEAVYTSKRAIYDRQMTRYDRPYTTVAAGGDRLLLDGHLMVGAEALAMWFHDLPKDADLLLVRNPMLAVIGMARLMLLDDTLTAELRGMALPNFGEGLINPRIEYALNDHWHLFTGASWYQGESKPLFVQNPDDPFPNLTPIGYLQENSEAFAGVKYHF
ncbi:MAG: DUF1302 family protein [Nitrospirae bacterium]|nr:DUF1302 family protein [Nitrospirota bacterium]